MTDWDTRFIRLAKEVATWSKDPDCKVGAVLIHPEFRNYSFGYNGFPQDIEDTEERLNNKELKNELTIHAEVNAIFNAQASVADWNLVCTKTPCLACAKLIVQAGIKSVLIPPMDPTSSWAVDNLKALEILEEANIQVQTSPDLI